MMIPKSPLTICLTLLAAALMAAALPAGLAIQPACAAEPAAAPAAEPARVYVPYEKLKGVFENEKQGVFLPYADFQRLWQAAQGTPAGMGGGQAAGAPVAYLVSTARFTGKVGAELASMQLELTIDVLSDDWVQVPLGLGEVAVVKTSFVEEGAGAAAGGAGAAGPARLAAVEPLLRVVDGQYLLLTRGKGRRILRADFVRQLVTRPGQNVLSFRTPAAAITTLELLIPEENMKVEVTPMLAASTSQADQDGKKITRVQAFLGTGGSVELKWKPTTQAAEELEPVVIAEQTQSIMVAEALVSYDVTFNYDIRRRGVDAFTIQLPGDFRVTGVDGSNISKWEMAAVPAAPAAPAAAAPAAAEKVAGQVLKVKLFSPAKDKYSLTVRMERFLQDAKAEVALTAVVTQEAIRQTGLIAISHSPRRSVELRDGKNLARVDVGRLAESLRNQPGVVAYRFISGDYAGRLAIDMVEPRITVRQFWALGVDSDRLDLLGQFNYTVERVGVFQLSMGLPDSPIAWEVLSVGPPDIVDSHQLVGKGRDRQLTILLKRELTGPVTIQLRAQANRPAADAAVDFALPLADAKNLQLYTGEFLLLLAEQLRAEVDKLEQLAPLPMNQATRWASIRTLAPAMAYEFRSIDRAKIAAAGAAPGAKFRIAVKPTQVSAVVNRLVNIQPGSIEQEAVIQYRVQYAPLDTFYVKLPASLADGGVEITGENIKEKPRIDALPPDQMESPATKPDGDDRFKSVAPATQPDTTAWAYYKVVLQSPVTGNYELKISARRKFQASADKATDVAVEPILAAGRLSDQSGVIAVVKADTLAIGLPSQSNLISGDPSSPADVPYGPHLARRPSLAFKYAAPPFALSLPVMAQKEADVFTLIASAAIIEQVLASDGTLNTHATWLLVTSRGDRIPITLPPGAKLFSVLLNGAEAAVEMGGREGSQRIVRLPPSAGQTSRVVLEVSYGLDHADAAQLAAPELADRVPFQQTLWRLWVPDERDLLKFSRTFGQLAPGQAAAMLASLNQDLPTVNGKPALGFRLTGQGVAFDFLRQGAPGTLSVLLVSRELFAIAAWAVIVLLGLAMLAMTGFHRCLFVLTVLLGLFVAQLYVPLLVGRILHVAPLPAAVVGGAWLAQWIFSLARRRGDAASALPPPSGAGEPPAAGSGESIELKE